MKKALLTTLALVFVCSVMLYAGGPNGPKGPKGPNCTQIEGVIVTIDSDSQFTLNDGTVVQVTDDTIILQKQVPITFNDLTVGITVKVCGQMDGDILIACKICVKCDGK
ncbi:MAG: hypothetical protein JW715_07515 [Sedimentisphaerales bacterium]|nr:hypothetical protein [Sedimentisphaerales bacterium]